jgi:FAD/FMN-containing dehydrogenase
MYRMNSKRVWVWVSLALGFLLLILVLGRPVIHLIRATWQDTGPIEKLPPGYVDDASRMNKTQVSEVWEIPADRSAAEQQLSKLLRQAQAAGLRVSVAGARHSMGGHTIYPGGIAINMLPFNRMELNEAKNILHVQAGAKWSEIVPYLDKRGRSIEVMQSDNSFTVGGSLSVNCHGWQYGRPPIASTVESFRLMKPDGTIIRASRQENKDLFALALGGYGLFGIILDADLRIVPNERLRLEQYVVPVDGALSSFERKIREKPNVSMVYARLNIVSDKLFQDVIITMFYPDPGGGIPELSEPGLPNLRRAILRGSAESDYGKELRWKAETKIQPFLAGKIFSRNQLLNESSDWYLNRSDESTDILHEYFIPRPGVREFLVELRKIIPKHGGNLLNVTVRDVDTDNDTFLRYADQPMIAFVMFFNQPRTAAADSRMQVMTQEMIDTALKHGGRYYLPYRLHATADQFHRAYPQAREFFDLKRHYDPHELFQNQFYVKYGRNKADG